MGRMVRAALRRACILPWEMYSLMRHPHPIKWVILLANIAVVLYMLVLRVQANAHRTAAAQRILRRLGERRSAGLKPASATCH